MSVGSNTQAQPEANPGCSLERQGRRISAGRCRVTGSHTAFILFLPPAEAVEMPGPLCIWLVSSYKHVSSNSVLLSVSEWCVLPPGKRRVRIGWEKKGLWSNGAGATGCPGLFSCLPLAGQWRGRRGGLPDDSALQESLAIQLDTVSGTLGTWDRLLALCFGFALSV